MAHLRFTDRRDGDLRVDGPQAPAVRAALVDLPWTWLRQVHGNAVVVVERPGAGSGMEADAAVTAASGAAVAVHTADCGPVALIADAGAVGVAHAGWRGLAGGVLEATVSHLRALAPGPVRAVVGPHIGPECYEFGADDLEALVAVLGPTVATTTPGGRPALDLAAATTVALDRAGVTEVTVVGGCTACDPTFFSHRARGDVGRQAVVAWIADGP